MSIAFDIRHLGGTHQIELFNRIPYALNDEIAGDLEQGRRRVEWTWLAIHDDRLLGRLLELPITRHCEGKPRNAILFGDGVEHIQRPRASGSSRSWFVRALDDAGLERMTIRDLRRTAASLAISSGANAARQTWTRRRESNPQYARV